MFKNMKLAAKLGVGFGFVLLILATVAAVSYLQFRKVAGLTDAVVVQNHLQAEMLKTVTEHVSWESEVNRLFADDLVTELTVETDDRKCRLGTFLQSEAVKRLAAEDSEFAELASQIAAPHHNMHASAAKIAELYKWHQYVSARKIQEETRREWDAIAHEVADSLERASQNVIRPAIEVAEEDQILGEVVKWNQIRAGINDEVIGPFLLLRIESMRLGIDATDDQWRRYTNRLQRLHNGMAAWSRLTEDNPHMRKVAAHLQGAIESFQAAGERYHEAMLAEREASASMDQALQVLQNETGPAAEKTLAILGNMRQRFSNASEAATEQITSGVEGSNLVVAVLSLLGIALGVVATVYITRSITKPIHQVIEGMTTGAAQVSAASAQVAQSSQQMAQGASEQAASLEEVSSSLEEMASMTRQNAENANQSDKLSKHVHAAAEKSMEAMERMSEAIVRIKTSSDQTARIIKTIDEIAFQTNLLALNAAVEAARAGEAGKGFAVVAEEVRSLAQRSAEAAKDTANLIEESLRNSDSGVTASGEVEEVLEEIAEGIEKVTQLIAEVSAASSEQAQGIDQQNKAVAEMDKLTQSNAANAEESASASAELSAQARDLNEMIALLVAVVGGGAQDNGSETVAPSGQAPETPPDPTGQIPAIKGKDAVDEVKTPDEVIPLDDRELADF
jgi:methyl-accepting chemotaxis protein